MCSQSTNKNEYKCTCPDEYYGRFCEWNRKRSCLTIPCKNNGTCTSAGNGRFQCACQHSWIGASCDKQAPEEVIEKCGARNPCQNGVFLFYLFIYLSISSARTHSTNTDNIITIGYLVLSRLINYPDRWATWARVVFGISNWHAFKISKLKKWY